MAKSRIRSLGLFTPDIGYRAGRTLILPFDGALRVDLRVDPHRAFVTQDYAALRADGSCPPVRCRRLDGTVRDPQGVGCVFSRALSAMGRALRYVCGYARIFPVELLSSSARGPVPRRASPNTKAATVKSTLVRPDMLPPFPDVLLVKSAFHVVACLPAILHHPWHDRQTAGQGARGASLFPNKKEADVAGHSTGVFEHLGLQSEAERPQVIVPELVCHLGPALQGRFPAGFRVVDPSAAIAA